MPEDDCQRAIETLQIKFVANYHHKSKIQLLSNIAGHGNMTLKDIVEGLYVYAEAAKQPITCAKHWKKIGGKHWSPGLLDLFRHP